MSPLEAIGAALGLFNQWLTIRQKIWCWPIGIASVFVYIFVFYDARLYSDMLLQVVYVALQLYGWANWIKLRHTPAGTPHRILAVSRLRSRDWAIVVVSIVALASLLGTLMGRFTGASYPFPDATATVLSIVAQYLQARKVLESWIIFLVANLLFIGIYTVKELYLTVGLFTVITVMAVFGFLRWRQAYRGQGGSHVLN